MLRRSLVFTSPGQVSICDEELSPPGPDQVGVQTLLSAISPGTEMLFYRGQFPTDLALDENIAAIQAQPAYPMKYGYSLVGRVDALGAAVDPAWLGRLVFAFHPHESRFNARVDDLLPLPPDITPEQAVLLPNMETAVGFVMDGAPLLGEEVVVFGQGIVGLLTTAVLARFPLGSLVTLDKLPHRRAISLEMGAHASFDPADIGQVKTLLAGGADLCFEVSGSPSALDQAIALTGYSGRILIGSWYGTKAASLDLGGRFHRSRIRLLSSQVSRLAPELSGRWTKARRFGVVWELLKEVQVSRLITHRIPFEQAAQAYQLIDHSLGETLQVVLTYTD